MPISGNYANTGGTTWGGGGAPAFWQAANRGGGGTYGMANAGNRWSGGGGGGYQPYSMAGAGWGGNTVSRQPTPAASPAAPAAAAPAATPGAAPAAGTPSTAGATATNPGGTYVNGQWVPSVTQTTTLSPEQQKILDATQTFQQSMLGAGNQMAGALPTGGLDLSGITAAPTMGQYNKEAADAVYQQQTAMLDPQWATQEQQLHDSLRDQGIPEGSAAWQQATDQFSRQKDLAYQQAKDSAIQEGYQVSQQQFEQGMQARQQGVSEAESKYQMPVSNLAQLMAAYQGTGGVQMPEGAAAQPSISPTDMAGNFQTQQAARQAQYQAQANQYASNVGGLSGLAGMVAMGLLA